MGVAVRESRGVEELRYWAYGELQCGGIAIWESYNAGELWCGGVAE